MGKGKSRMKPEEFLQVLHMAEQLKQTPRHCWTSDGSRETVAAHSWRTALAAWFLQDVFPEVEISRVIVMCLIHDLGETFTGDIPAFEKTAADGQKEERCLLAWVDGLPSPYDGYLRDLYREMEAQETAEAKLYRALDKLEALVQHNESDTATWLPLEYQLNRTYGNEQVAWSPYLQQLRQLLLAETEQKIAEAKQLGFAPADV